MKPKKKLPTPKAILKLFVSPRTSPQFVEVFLHANRKNMLAHRKVQDEHGTRYCEAFFSPDNYSTTVTFVPGKKEITTQNPRLGAIHFHPGSLTMGVIVHELFHVVMFYAQTFGLIPHVHDDRSEERCAEVIGCFMAQLMVQMNDRKELRNYQSKSEREYFE